MPRSEDAMKKCSVPDCGKPVDWAGEDFYRLVQGWEQVRGAKGGLNAIRRRKELGPVMCKACMVAAKKHVDPGQGAML